MKNYIAPQIEMNEIHVLDVITLSGVTGDAANDNTAHISLGDDFYV